MSNKEEDEREFTRDLPSMEFSRLRIIKNVVVLSVVFFVTFTAYDCLSMLQSTLNHENGLGVVCQAVVYGCFCLSALLFPKYVIQKLGCKLTLVLSMFLYVPYIASNLHPHWSFMIPAAVLNGLAASLLWGAQCQYLNEMAIMYVHASVDKKLSSSKNSHEQVARSGSDLGSKSTQNPHRREIWHSGVKPFKQSDETSSERDVTFDDKSYCEKQNENASGKNIQGEISLPCKVDRTNPFRKFDTATVSSKDIQSMTARFFGIHGMAYLSTHMWSNLMSYFILQNDASHLDSILNSSCVCGAQFCNENSECLDQNLQEPSQETRTFLISLCTALGLISIIFLAFLLDSLNDRKEKVKFSVEFLLATCRHLRNKNQIFLTPLSFYVGMMQGFYVGDFNMSFVGCAWGTFHVGLVSVCYGAACATSSSLSGCAVKYVGRIPILVFSALLNVACQILLILWRPNAENPALFFITAGFWGTSVGIFWSQVKAIYGFLFKNDEEVAFAAYHLWYSLGFCLSFAYSNHLCTYLKIYVLMSVLILGIIGYLCVEIFFRQKIKRLEK